MRRGHQWKQVVERMRSSAQQRDTAFRLRLFQLFDRGEMAVGQHRVGERPEMLGRVELGGVGRQDQQVDVVRHGRVGTGVPPRPIEHQHELFVWPGSRAAGERRQHGGEQLGADLAQQKPDGAARGRIDEGRQIAPLVAVLHRRHRPGAGEGPHPMHDGLQADAVFVAGPQLDLRVRKRGCYLAEKGPEPPLNAAWAAASAFTCRGRGRRSLSRRR